MLQHWLMKNNHCFQTSHAIESYNAIRNLWDTPIFESQNFVAVPTVGALVEGWLLIVPRTPILSFARISPPLFSELGIFLNEIVPAIESVYGPVSLFEHGPAFATSKVGCGVDYAHLHLVPVDCNLIEGAKQIAPWIRWGRVASIEDVSRFTSNNEGYWFVQQPFAGGECYVGLSSNTEPVSQLFRKVIANHIGRPFDFDWKAYCGEDVIAATVEKLTDAAILV